MKSMTGFGRQDYRDEQVEISVEIKTVNHRYRDFFLKFPRALNPVEEQIRKTLSQTIARGRIELFIKFEELGTANKKIVFNRELAKSYINVLNAIKDMDSMLTDEIDVGLVARFPDVVEIAEIPGDDAANWKLLEPVLRGALDQLDASRRREGAAMKADIASHCTVVEGKVADIAALAPGVLDKAREDLRKKVEEYTQSAGVDEQRLLTEVTIMADKLAIDEELSRLNTHTARLKDLLEIEDEPVGRKLDFLVQEMNREINTIGSKIGDVDIAGMVVDVKSEIEKIREQIQNIE
jgi:uncharacterized protein (TIGR00255 family)